MQQQLTLARQAAQEAGQRLLELLGKATVHHKGVSHNLVTQADLESEEIIFGRLHDAFPDHRFLREEGESTGTAEDDHLWVIDPLDATNNYAHGIPHFSISIAYAEKGVVKLGVVYDPCRNEFFTALRGQGAFRNDQPIRVSERESLSQSMVGTGFYYDRGRTMTQTLSAIGHLFSLHIHGIRRMGSAAIDLSWVACGRFDAFFEYILAPWDYAAGSLLIHEAGGQCTDRTGAPLTLRSESIIASNRKLSGEFLDAIRWNG